VGLTPEELIERFPHLTLAQVHETLVCYCDNIEEIEKDLAQNTEGSARKRFSF